MKLLSSITLFFAISTSLFSADAERGKNLYLGQGKCLKCHGENGLGIEAEEAPKIAGQYEWYILTQLNNFKAKVRKNEKMYPYIKDLSEKDYQDLAAYVATLK